MTWDEDVPLVTDDEVHTICTELPAATDAAPFINVAHLLCCQLFADITTISDKRYETIEVYLASHFAAVSNAVPSFEGVGKLQESAQFKVDLGLNFTKYGQQAIALDTSGLLRGIATGRKAMPRILSLDPTSTEASVLASEKIADREAAGDYT